MVHHSWSPGGPPKDRRCLGLSLSAVFALLPLSPFSGRLVPVQYIGCRHKHSISHTASFTQLLVGDPCVVSRRVQFITFCLLRHFREVESSLLRHYSPPVPTP